MDNTSDHNGRNSNSHGVEEGTNATALTVEDSDVPAPGETTTLESKEERQPPAAGEVTSPDEKIARAVTASQIGAFCMSGEAGLKENVSVDRVEIANGTTNGGRRVSRAIGGRTRRI